MFLKTSKEKVTKARFSRRSAQNQVPKAQFPSNARFPSASKRKAIKARVPKGVLHAGFPQQVPKTHQLPTLSLRNISKPTSFGPEFCQIRAPKLLPDSGPEAPARFGPRSSCRSLSGILSKIFSGILFDSLSGSQSGMYTG